MCFALQRRAIFRHQNFQKCSEPHVFCTFSLANVLLATAACIWHENSKSAPTMRCLVHFHLQMCFALKRRAIFRHENFKKCSNHEVFCTFSLAKCAFRHSGVQFWISPQNTHLRTRRFNRPTFRLTRHTNHWKNTAWRDYSLTFGADVSSFFWLSRYCIFFLLTWLLYSASHMLFNPPYCRKVTI